MTPPIVAERLAVLVSELLPSEPRDTYYDRAREVLSLTARIVAAEEEREMPAGDLAARAADRWSDVVGWRCTVTGPSPRCRPILRRSRAA